MAKPSRLQNFVIFLLDNPGPVKRWPKEFPQPVRARAVANGLAVPVDGSETSSAKHYRLTDTGIFFGHRWRALLATLRTSGENR